MGEVRAGSMSSVADSVSTQITTHFRTVGPPWFGLPNEGLWMLFGFCSEAASCKPRWPRWLFNRLTTALVRCANASYALDILQQIMCNPDSTHFPGLNPHSYPTVSSIPISVPTSNLRRHWFLNSVRLFGVSSAHTCN